MGEPALKEFIVDSLDKFNKKFDEQSKLTLLIKEEVDKKNVNNDEKLNKISDDFTNNVTVLNEYKDTLKKIEERQNKFEALANVTGKSVDELEEKRGEVANLFDIWSRKNHDGEVTFAKGALRDEHPELYALCVKEKYPNLSIEQIEKKGLSVDSDVDGGFLVQTLLMPIMKTRIFETSQVRAIAGSITISTDSVEWPIDDDQAATGGWVGEQQARPVTGTPKLRMAKIFAHEQYANPEITQKLLDDAAFSVENWLAEKITDIFMREENTRFVIGDGTAKPRGFMTYPAAAGPAFEVNAIEQISSGAAAALTTDGIIDLQIALKEAYQTNATWVMNRRSFGEILKLKNGQGDYLWNRALDKSTQVPFDLLGRPVRFFDDMPVVAADSLSIAYGDFKRAYMIVDRIGMRVLRDPFTARPQIQFYSTKRVGGDILNFEAIKIQKVEV